MEWLVVGLLYVLPFLFRSLPSFPTFHFVTSHVSNICPKQRLTALRTIVATTFEPSIGDSTSRKLAWSATMTVLGVACWSAMLSTLWLVSLRRCKYEIKRIRQSVKLNVAVKGDVEVLEGWWVKSWWLMSWMSAWVDELLVGSGGRGRWD